MLTRPGWKLLGRRNGISQLPAKIGAQRQHATKRAAMLAFDQAGMQSFSGMNHTLLQDSMHGWANGASGSRSLRQPRVRTTMPDLGVVRSRDPANMRARIRARKQASGALGSSSISISSRTWRDPRVSMRVQALGVAGSRIWASMAARVRSRTSQAAGTRNQRSQKGLEVSALGDVGGRNPASMAIRVHSRSVLLAGSRHWRSPEVQVVRGAGSKSLATMAVRVC
mmetsp:Transcript_133258/g.344839  ORF Transcript_133258/g.344839 Transcript_133258/m.344839 type:complete len:225 (-) Transcript_133258:705-1379(-)